MPLAHLNILAAFLTVAEERSFTRAAKRLGLSRSAVSHAIRGLEERLGVRLLARTTRSVAPTEAGTRLISGLRPALAEVESVVDQSSRYATARPGGSACWSLRSQPPWCSVQRSRRSAAATRMSFSRSPRRRRDARSWWRQASTLASTSANQSSATWLRCASPPISAWPWSGHRNTSRLIASRERRTTSSSTPASTCAAGSAGPYRWEFEKNGEALAVDVKGPLIADSADLMIRAAIDGLGLTFSFEEYVAPHITRGSLVRVLEDWCPPFAGYFLYYPSKRQQSRLCQPSSKRFGYRPNTLAQVGDLNNGIHEVTGSIPVAT
jgi:DNA-binding transcriptional LysR family regulator